MSSKRDFSQYPSRVNTPKVTLRLPADIVDTLKEDADQRGISLSEAIRELILLGLGQQQQPTSAFSSSSHSL